MTTQTPGPDLQVLRATIAHNTRNKGAKHPDTLEAKRDYQAAIMARDIAARLEGVPPLTESQIETLTALLRRAS